MSDTPALRTPILAAEIHRDITRVHWLADIEGRYRLVASGSAPTTLDADRGVADGLQQALRRIEETTLYTIFSPSGRPTIPMVGSPPAQLYCCSDAAAPLRITLLAAQSNGSLASDQRACQLPFCEAPSIYRVPAASQDDDGLEETLLAGPMADVVIFGEGLGGALERLARRLLALYTNFARDQRPIVLCAAAQPARRSLHTILGADFDLRPINPTVPSRDAIDVGDLQRALVRIYEQTCLLNLPGYEYLADWCAQAPISSHRALTQAAPFLPDAAGKANALIVDLQAATSAVLEVPSGAAIGLRGGYHTTQASGPELTRWLPLGYPADESVCERLYPGESPVLDAETEAWATTAGAQQALYQLGQALREDPAGLASPARSDYIALHGELLAQPQGCAAAWAAILNGLQSTGATRVVFDVHHLWAALSAAAGPAETAVSEVLAQPAMSQMGLCLAPGTKARGNRTALAVRITDAASIVTQHSVPPATLVRLAAPDGLIRAETRAGWRSYPNQSILEFQAAIGQLGLVLDTRPRPLEIEQAGRFWRMRTREDWQALVD
ncbi:MAG: hypothetical protein GXY52_04445 [Chloroflexi bacterium]|nr:hypothetical protein [Chloroflexota bacterium]